MLRRFIDCILLLAVLMPVLSLASDEEEAEALPAGQAPPAPSLFTNPPYSLDRIVVVATRTERELFSTPAAVSTIDAQQIEEIQPYGYQDVFEGIPGVAVQGGPRRIAEEPAIRGFSDEQIVIRIDGTRQNFNRAHSGRFLLDPDLVRSIEIVRGASSAVYGSGALGGVFDLALKNGRDFTAGQNGAGARVKLGYQSNGDEFASFNTVFAQQGAFDVLGSFVYRNLGEDLEDGADQAILSSEDKLGNGLIKLGYEFDPFQRLEFTTEILDNEGLNPSNANDEATATNLVNRNTERRNYRLHYSYNDPDQTWLDLNAVIYRNSIEVNEFRLDDDRLDDSDFATNGFELYNTSRFDLGLASPIALTYGMEIYGDSQQGTRNGAPRLQFPDAEVDYRAGYIQAEVPLTSRLTLIPGLRFDRFEYANNGGFPTRNDDRFSPKASLGYELTQHLYLWVDYSEGFRAPSLTELFADGVHFIAPLGPSQVVINEFVSTPDLKPEKVEQVQGGARYRLDGLFREQDRLDVDLVYYTSDVDDFVDQVVTFISGPPSFDPATQTLVFPGTTQNFNVDAKINGFEADVRYDAGLWYAAASMSVLDADRKSDGTGLASTQPDQASLSLGARFLNRQLTLGAQLVAANDRRNVPEGAIATDGYGKTDLFATWHPTKGPLLDFEINFAVDNVFDKNFRIHPNGLNQPGRTFKFTVTKTFDSFRS